MITYTFGATVLTGFFPERSAPLRYWPLTGLQATGTRIWEVPAEDRGWSVPAEDRYDRRDRLWSVEAEP